ncbi:MAG: hemolysin III family protein [Firmicutes bacterium]|nr:hemolysin III family protein [Bacillota bacterium]
MNNLQSARLNWIKLLKDPVSGLTHLGGALLSIVGLVLLIRYAERFGTVKHIVTFAIFGATLILLYTSSALYHLLNVSENISILLRRIDHMMIYILIAGTYTPVCVIGLTGAWGLTMLITVWALAAAGITMTVVWFGAPRWLTTAVYLLMGWLVILAFYPLIHALPVGAITWLAIGGLLYTVGAVVYGCKWPKINSKWFGFHEVFHLFVIAGSLGHFWLMFKYLMYI